MRPPQRADNLEWLDRIILSILLIVAAFFLYWYFGAAAHCAMDPIDDIYLQVKVTADVPGDTMCKAELDTKTIAKFQKFLIQYGHDQLKIIEGTALATAKGVQQKTFVVVLKCVDKDRNVYAVGVSFIKDKLEKIEVKPTGEKMQLI